MSHSDIIDSKPVSFTVEINWLSGFTSELVKRFEHMIYKLDVEWQARGRFSSQRQTHTSDQSITHTYPKKKTYPPTSFEFYNPLVCTKAKGSPPNACHCSSGVKPVK